MRIARRFLEEEYEEEGLPNQRKAGRRHKPQQIRQEDVVLSRARYVQDLVCAQECVPRTVYPVHPSISNVWSEVSTEPVLTVLVGLWLPMRERLSPLGTHMKVRVVHVPGSEVYKAAQRSNQDQDL